MKNGLILPIFILNSALIFLTPDFGYCQMTEFFKCPGEILDPPGAVPPEAPCDINPNHPNFDCQSTIAIGEGTPFPKSSDIGTSLTGDVCITGKFIVDEPFTFLNAVVRIGPGIEIRVEGTPNYFDPESALVIDHSELFSCKGLWKGIVTDLYGCVTTRNNSRIEDALVAIHAESPSSLFVQNTTFNRNWIGLELVGNNPSTSMVWTFSGNRFFCTAPLKGSSKFTFAGIKLINAEMVVFPSSNLNWFRDLNYGIYAEGAWCEFGSKKLRFERIAKDGIYMERGVCSLYESNFINCQENGINIGTVQSLDIIDVSVLLTTAIPLNIDIHRTGIYIDKFDIGAYVNINHFSFSADMEGTYNKVRGIYLKGGNVEAGTEIRIHGESNFGIRANYSQGIYLNGIFPSTSTTEIWGNHFRISNILGEPNYRPSGIETYGDDKNNLSIIGNTFTSYFFNPPLPPPQITIAQWNKVSG